MNDDDKKIDEWAEWRVDELDPDNYLVIPEFGVRPESVQYKGFQCPLVYPGVTHREVAKAIRSMLIAARLTLRTRFRSLAEVYRLFDEVLDIDDPAEMNERQREANFYMLIVIRLNHAAAPQTPEEQRLMYLADASSLLSGWQLIGQHELPQMLAKSRGSKGGKKSGETRAQKAIDKVAVVAAAKELGWPAKTYGVQKKLSAKFHCDVSYVGRILAAEKKFSTEASSVPS
jgi:hypothetical protein